MAKDKNRQGVVFSTNPDFEYRQNPDEKTETLPPGKQLLRLLLEKRSGGKLVTVVLGFVGLQTDLDQLARTLKNHCGSGGTAKDGEIVIQGDHRLKVQQYLTQAGYRCKG